MLLSRGWGARSPCTTGGVLYTLGFDVFRGNRRRRRGLDTILARFRKYRSCTARMHSALYGLHEGAACGPISDVDPLATARRVIGGVSFFLTGSGHQCQPPQADEIIGPKSTPLKSPWSVNAGGKWSRRWVAWPEYCSEGLPPSPPLSSFGCGVLRHRVKKYACRTTN